MTSREITIALQLAIAIFAAYLFFRRLGRLWGREREAPAYYVAEIPASAHLNPDEIVTIAWFREMEPAKVWAQKLRERGIEASIADNSPELKVPARDAGKAAEIIRQDPASDSHL
ncbi:MAG: hypothetical protein GX139_03815 [Armatimonadetes bacterium]|jgi:hypothetical protein|nr:hypothetical protein [Armatimonadota bacterium]